MQRTLSATGWRRCFLCSTLAAGAALFALPLRQTRLFYPTRGRVSQPTRPCPPCLPVSRWESGARVVATDLRGVVQQVRQIMAKQAATAICIRFHRCTRLSRLSVRHSMAELTSTFASQASAGQQADFPRSACCPLTSPRAGSECDHSQSRCALGIDIRSFSTNRTN